MKTGFPRPRIEYKGVKYPQPYNTEDDKLVSCDTKRSERCRKKNMCGMCGEYVAAKELAMYALRSSKYASTNFVEDSGPYHIKCAHLVSSLCPQVAIDEYSLDGEQDYFFAPGLRRDVMTYFSALDLA